MTGTAIPNFIRCLAAGAALAAMAVSAPVAAKESGGDKPMCTIAGPQSPRDVTAKAGSNPTKFSLAPEAGAMQLCNIHFHKNAEHKAKGYAKLTGDGDHQGYVCAPGDMGHKGEADHKGKHHDTHGKAAEGGCGGISDGDTIEVHWVFTSCLTAKPGKGLGSCVPAGCGNPQLRVEARTFLLKNGAPLDFLTLTALKNNDLVSLLPAKDRVQYTGSTTGPSYTNEHCSPYQVSWSVDQTCHSLDLASVNKWCASGNVFGEDHAHGVRKLVTDPKFLSPIK
jgi:hypothetical protein